MPERGQGRMVATPGDAGGVSEKLDPSRMVEMGAVVVNKPCGLDKVALPSDTNSERDVAGVLGAVIEGGEDVAVRGEEAGGGVLDMACCRKGNQERNSKIVNFYRLGWNERSEREVGV